MRDKGPDVPPQLQTLPSDIWVIEIPTHVTPVRSRAAPQLNFFLCQHLSPSKVLITITLTNEHTHVNFSLRVSQQP